MDDLANAYRRWIDDAVLTGDRRREGTWTESIAVGSESFVNATKEKLGIKAQGREVIEAAGSYALRESSIPYKTILRRGNDGVRPQNGYYWNDTVGMSET
jgi:putative transposase